MTYIKSQRVEERKCKICKYMHNLLVLFQSLSKLVSAMSSFVLLTVIESHDALDPY